MSRAPTRAPEDTLAGRATRLDRIIARIKRNPAVVMGVALGGVVVGIASFTDAASNLVHRFTGTTPDEARRELSQLSLPFSEQAFVERVRAHDPRAVTLFLRAGMRPDATDAAGATGLMFAAAAGDTLLADELLKAGAKVGIRARDSSTALAWAASAGRRVALERLLARRPDGSAVGEALIAAAGAGQDSVVAALLGSGADLKTYGGPALRRTLDSGLDRDSTGARLLARRLVRRGVEIQSADDAGMTPLLVAVARHDLEVVTLLLGAGANVEASNPQGRRALHIAAYDGQTGIVEALLVAGADVQARCPCPGFYDGGWTALLFAARDGYTEVIQRLVAHGSNVDEADNRRVTPLMIAAHEHKVAAVRVLLSAGARVDLRDRSGWTALDHAEAWRRWYLGEFGRPADDSIPALLRRAADVRRPN